VPPTLIGRTSRPPGSARLRRHNRDDAPPYYECTHVWQLRPMQILQRGMVPDSTADPSARRRAHPPPARHLLQRSPSLARRERRRDALAKALDRVICDPKHRLGGERMRSPGRDHVAKSFRHAQHGSKDFPCAQALEIPRLARLDRLGRVLPYRPTIQYDDDANKDPAPAKDRQPMGPVWRMEHRDRRRGTT
jgi:hypothetical protein